MIHTECSVGKIARYQGAVIQRMAVLLEDSDVIWASFLRSIRDCLATADITDEEQQHAGTLRKAITLAEQFKLGTWDGDAAMAGDETLRMLRRMEGEVLNRLLSYFAGHLFDDLGLSPSKVQLQAKQSLRQQLLATQARPAQPPSVGGDSAQEAA